MSQAIPTYVWTKLLGHDVEVWQASGANIMVDVHEAGLSTSPPGADVELRAPGGTYPPDWAVPIAGVYGFCHGAYRLQLKPGMVVRRDARRETDQVGTFHMGPEIAMSSGERLITNIDPARTTLEWRSR